MLRRKIVPGTPGKGASRSPWMAVRVGLLTAVAGTLAVVGIPDPSSSLSPAANSARSRTSIPSKLEALWDRFAESRDPRLATVADFQHWFEEVAGVHISTDLDSSGSWTHGVTQDSVRITLAARGSQRRDRWTLEVGPSRWAGADYTLATHDLGCVLCHAAIERDDRPGLAAPVPRVGSRVPYGDPIGASVRLAGTLGKASEATFTPDLEAWLEDSRARTGSVRSRRGGWIPLGEHVARSAAGLMTPGIEISGECPGHVVLCGTASDPVQLDGNLVIDGDLVLAGVVRGDGQISVRGGVMLVGSIEHVGDGSLRIAALGSILAGDVLRARHGEARAVSGDPKGSFSFLMESLARFNGALVEAGRDAERLFRWSEQAPSMVLVGGRSLGHWDDPAIERIDAESGRTVGPSGNPPWLPTATLRDWTAEGVLPGGGPSSHAGTSIDAVLVTTGAFLAVAQGCSELGAGPGLDSPLETAHDRCPDPVPAGAVRVRGAIVAERASIHAPAGLWIQDDAGGRAAQPFRDRLGIEHRIMPTRDSVAGPLRADRLPPLEPVAEPLTR